MNVFLEERWQDFVDRAVKSGRNDSADDVIREGLRLVEAREVELEALRTTLSRSIAEPGCHNDEDVAAAIKTRLAEFADGA